MVFIDHFSNDDIECGHLIKFRSKLITSPYLIWWHSKSSYLKFYFIFICQQYCWCTMALIDNADMKKNIDTEGCGWTASFSSSNSIGRITSLINHLPESTFFSIIAFSLPLPQIRLRASHIFKCNKGLLTYDLAASSEHTH